MARPRSTEIDSKVLAATYALIEERGLGSISMDEISKVTGVAKTTIYRRWDSADELAMRAIEANVASFDITDTGTLEGDIKALYQRVIAVGGNEGFRRVLLSLMSRAASDPKLQAVHDQLGEHRSEPLMAAIERARERGEIDPSLNNTVARLLIEAPITVLLLQPRPYSADDLDKVIGAVVRSLSGSD